MNKNIGRLEKSQLVEKFVQLFPDIYLAMKGSEHGVSQIETNPYHVEGDVWTHTMMVVNQSKTYLGAICALCHDIGKPESRRIVKQDDFKRTRFSGHESLSFFMAPEILDAFGLDESDKKMVMIVIGLHGSFRKNSIEEFVQKTTGLNDETVELLIELLEADSKGRFCTDDAIWEHDAETVLCDGYRDTMIDIHGYKFKNLKKTITLMVGLPGSGKSTYIEAHLNDAFLVSRDQFIEKLGQGRNYDEKLGYFELNKRAKAVMEKEFDTSFEAACLNHDNLVIDMTNLTRKNRRSFVSKAKNGFKIKMIVFTSGLKECEARNNNRKGKNIKPDTLKRMASRFDFPLFDEAHEVEFV